jgi:hypothetical protein
MSEAGDRERTAANYGALVAVGEVPTSTFPRWGHWIDAPAAGLPPVLDYACRRTREPMTIDGRLDEGAWAKALWSEPFGAIADGARVALETRVALLWDERCLYAGFKVEDHDVRASMTGFHDHVYIEDEDVELFIEGEGAYFEMGANPINTIYEIRWTWIQALVERRDWQELDRLFRTPNFLYFLAREGEEIGRHGDLDWELPGLEHAVQVDGTLNRPALEDRGWTAEFALPWEGLGPILGQGRRLPPRAGDGFRMTAYRAHHGEGAARRHSSVGWSWSVMGNDNIHVPERWNRILLVEDDR